jgi:Mrr N-terminal domain
MYQTVRAVEELGGSAQGREITAQVVADIGATDEQLEITYDKRAKSVLIDRIDWARSYVTLGGILEQPRRGLTSSLRSVGGYWGNPRRTSGRPCGVSIESSELTAVPRQRPLRLTRRANWPTRPCWRRTTPRCRHGGTCCSAGCIVSHPMGSRSSPTTCARPSVSEQDVHGRCLVDHRRKHFQLPRPVELDDGRMAPGPVGAARMWNNCLTWHDRDPAASQPGRPVILLRTFRPQLGNWWRDPRPTRRSWWLPVL